MAMPFVGSDGRMPTLMVALSFRISATIHLAVLNSATWCVTFAMETSFVSCMLRNREFQNALDRLSFGFCVQCFLSTFDLGRVQLTVLVSSFGRCGQLIRIFNHNRTLGSQWPSCESTR